ncbi:MAG: acyl carrier protein [Croceivirga sp.]
MNDKIIAYITDNLLYEQLDDPLTADENLLESGLIDSLGIMKLVVFIESEFEVAIPPEDMTIENFMTVNHIKEYLMLGK